MLAVKVGHLKYAGALLGWVVQATNMCVAVTTWLQGVETC